jgi:hypothetical protein
MHTLHFRSQDNQRQPSSIRQWAAFIFCAGLFPLHTGCTPPSSFADIEFWALPRATAQSGLLEQENASGGGQPFAWTETELSPTLTQHSLGDLEVRYTAGTNKEALLFVRDLDEANASITQVGSDHVDQNLIDAQAPFDWNNNTSEVYLPGALALQRLPSDGPTISAVVSKDDYWLGVSAAGPAAAPSGNGSIKSLRVLDHGQCSASTAIGPQLAEASSEFWTKLVKKTRDSCSSADAHLEYSRAVTYLGHDHGVTHSAPGGFYWDARYYINVHNALAGDMDWRFFVRYEFSLDSFGLLNVVAGDTHVSTSGYQDTEDLALLIGALTGSVVGIPSSDSIPAAFASKAAALQIKKLPLPVNESCSTADDPTISGSTGTGPSGALVSECAETAKTLGVLAHDTALQMAMSEAEGKQLGEAILASDGVHLRHWSCGPDLQSTAGDGASYCRFILGAKRVNVYPDEVELVWFDGKEPNNATYAVWVALQGLDPTIRDPALAQMCSYQSVPPVYDTSYRPWARTTAAPDDALGDGGTCWPW